MASLAVLLLVLLTSGASDEGTRFEERRTRARTALQEGRLDQAEQLYRELITLYPQRIPPYQGLAEVFAARGNRGGAVDLLLEVGRTLVEVSREQEALAPLEQALGLDPERAEAHALLCPSSPTCSSAG